MSHKVKSILILLGIVISVAYLAFSVASFSNRGESKTCKKLDVYIKDSADLNFISEKKITRILHRNGINPIGQSLKDINTTAIEKVLSEHPAIKEVECYKTPSGNLRIDIWQKKPIFRVMSNNGNYYIDDEKNTIPISDDFAAYVPIVTGDVNKEFAMNELFDFIVFLRDNKFWNSQIEQININKDNEVELIPRVGDQIILLGTLDDYEKKLNKLMILYEDGLNNIGWNQYSKINLQYKGQIICTKNILP